MTFFLLVEQYYVRLKQFGGRQNILPKGAAVHRLVIKTKPLALIKTEKTGFAEMFKKYLKLNPKQIKSQYHHRNIESTRSSQRYAQSRI